MHVFLRLWSRCERSLVLALLGAVACAHRPSAKARETARISYDMGVSAFQRGDGREALRALLHAERQDPGLPEVHNALGLVYHALDKREQALAEYRQAVSLRPTFSEARNNCGVLLLDMSRYDEAIAAFQAALGNMLYSSPVLAEGNLGWALYKKGDVAAAKEHLAGALASDPQFCRGYQWLMRIAIDTDDAPEALLLAARCSRHCGNDDKLAHPVDDEFRRNIDHMAALAHLRLGHDRDAHALLVRCAGPATDEAKQDSAQARCRASLSAAL